MNLIAHFDEIFLKGNNQKSFVDRLRNNIEKLFPGCNIKRIESGIWIENFKEEDLKRLALTPGVANFAEAYICGLEIAEIKNALENIEWGSDVKTFRIKAERSDKRYPLNSMQLEKELGAAINIKFGYKVNLNNPDLTIHVDIASDKVIFYGNETEGIGGLPVGSSGKVLCLISGGIDSPVAAYKMMVRGAEVELVHFQNQTRVTEEVSQKIIDLAKILSGYQGKTKLHIVPFEKWQKQIIMNIPADYRMLITRRIMFKIATNIAQKEKCGALITGDSLGQVASQTLENLQVVYEASDMLKISPLMGTNKREIMKLARQIETLDISNRPYEDCCSLFVAKHPQTHARISDVVKLENLLDLSALEKSKNIIFEL